MTLIDVGHELTEVARRQEPAPRGRSVVADDQEEHQASFSGKLLELAPEHDVALIGYAVDDDDVTAHVFHQRADGRDADATGDQEHLLSFAGGFGEHAEGALGDHARPRGHVSERSGEVAERLDGDPEGTSVGHSRERERVRRPPTLAVEKPPQEELARPSVQAM